MNPRGVPSTPPDNPFIGECAVPEKMRWLRDKYNWISEQQRRMDRKLRRVLNKSVELDKSFQSKTYQDDTLRRKNVTTLVKNGSIEPPPVIEID